MSAIAGIEGGPVRKIDPPDSVIELRTHGVSGTPPESMLNCSAVVQVWGDDTGRFFRAADTLGEELWKVSSLNAEESDAPVTRYREGYHWGKMTSGGLRQALWALLIPFALVNLSQWMVPPAVDRGRRWPVTWLRALVRVVGLGLTLMLMIQLSIVVADMLAVQCYRDEEANCLQSLTPMVWLRAHDATWTAWLVLLALAVPVFVGSWITKNSRDALQPKGADLDSPNEPANLAATTLQGVGMPEGPVGPEPNIAASDFYAREAAVPARTLHGIAALAAAALVVSGGWYPLRVGTGTLTWVVATMLIAFCVVCALFLDDPRSSGGRYHGGRLVTCLLGGRRPVRALWWGAAALNLAVAVFGSFLPVLENPPERWRTGLDLLVERLFDTLAVLCAVALVVALVAALQSRRAYFTSPPTAFKPWLLGITTAVVLPLAALLGAGFGAGVSQTVHNCLTTGCKPQLLAKPDEHVTLAVIRMPKAYDAIALLWGMTSVIGGAVALAAIIAALCYSKFVHSYRAAEVVQGKAMRVAWLTAAVKVQGPRIILFAVSVAVITGLISALAIDLDFSRWVRDHAAVETVFRLAGLLPAADLLRNADGTATGVSTFLQGIGLFALALFILGLLYAIYNAYRRPDSAGRSLGVLWDLASFWPTESHPLVPPCYARKAIDDLTTRVRWYRQQYPSARIVLCGHSQGSLLMYATVLRLARLDMANPDAATRVLPRVGLVTHGSQLQWAFGRAFPDMLSYYSHLTVMAALGDRWYNLVRFTDPLGGAVLSWNLRVDDDRAKGDEVIGDWMPGGPETPRTFFTTTSKARVVGHERWLPDPVLKQPIFPARKHSDYTLDAQWDDVVALAAGVDPVTSRP